MYPLFSLWITLIIFFFHRVNANHGDSLISKTNIPEVTIYGYFSSLSSSLKQTLDHSLREKTQKIFLTDALKELRSGHLSSFGHDALPSYVSIRGAKTEDTQVQIWGVALNNPADGGRYDFSDSFSDDFENISLKNFSSSTPIGGIIELEPRSGIGDLCLKAKTEAGIPETTTAALEMSGSTSASHYYISSHMLQKNAGNLKNHLHGNSITNNHKKTNVTSRWGYKINDIWDIDIFVSHVKSKSPINRVNQGLPQKSPDHGSQQQTISMMKNHFQTFHQRWLHDIIFGQVYYRHDSDIYSNKTSNYGKTFTSLYQSHYKISCDHDILTSIGVMEENVKLANSSLNHMKSGHTSFTYKIFSFSPFHFEMTGRLNYHQYFKTHGTYFAKVKYILTPHLIFFTSYGTGYTTPTAFDLFPSTFGPGNTHLKPMKSKNFEGGIEINPLKDISITLTYFYLKINDLLSWQYTMDGKIRSINESQRDSQGIESTVQWKFHPQYSIRSGYTLTKARDLTTHLKPIRLPQHRIFNRIQKIVSEKMDVFGEVFYESTTSDYAFINNKKKRVGLPSLLNIRLGGTYALNDDIKLTSRVENILNVHTEKIYGYPQQGISFFVGFEIKNI